LTAKISQKMTFDWQKFEHFLSTSHQIFFNLTAYLQKNTLLQFFKFHRIKSGLYWDLNFLSRKPLQPPRFLPSQAAAAVPKGTA
jgi:hypothetical protein